MGDGALTGQWVAVTHCNELGEDKKKKEEQHGILGDVIDPTMQWPFRASPTSWIFPGHALSIFLYAIQGYMECVRIHIRHTAYYIICTK